MRQGTKEELSVHYPIQYFILNQLTQSRPDACYGDSEIYHSYFG